MPYYSIVEDKGEFWIADEFDYVAGPFKTLQLAEWELEVWEDDAEEDEDA